MTNEWYEFRVKYEKTFDSGEKKKVTETYVVKAVSVSDAESRIIKEMKASITGEFSVKAVKVASFKEIFKSTEERFYLCKIMIVSFDDDSGKEKKKSHEVLVQAEDFNDAKKRLESGLTGTMSDWEIFSIVKSHVIAVYD